MKVVSSEVAQQRLRGFQGFRTAIMCLVFSGTISILFGHHVPRSLRKCWNGFLIPKIVFGAFGAVCVLHAYWMRICVP